MMQFNLTATTCAQAAGQRIPVGAYIQDAQLNLYRMSKSGHPTGNKTGYLSAFPRVFDSHTMDPTGSNAITWSNSPGHGAATGSSVLVSTFNIIPAQGQWFQIGAGAKVRAVPCIGSASVLVVVDSGAKRKLVAVRRLPLHPKHMRDQRPAAEHADHLLHSGTGLMFPVAAASGTRSVGEARSLVISTATSMAESSGLLNEIDITGLHPVRPTSRSLRTRSDPEASSPRHQHQHCASPIRP